MSTLKQFGENYRERVENAIRELQQGNGILLVDDENRENEGDVIYSAKKMTEKDMALMIRECSGIVCLCLTEEKCKRLGLKQMVDYNTSKNQTAFTISIEANKGITTGVSAKDRLTTIKTAISENATSEDLAHPGHIFPLTARNQGVFERRGHTEGSVDLMKLSGLKESAVLSELTNENGTMARLPEIMNFAKKNNMTVVSIEDIFQYRLTKAKNEKSMKQFPKPIDVMKMMHQYISDAYKDLPTKGKGIIQFCLTEDNEKVNCYFDANGEDIKFSVGKCETYNVRLESSLSDWLALADNRLNPVIGIILRKLKFKGDISYFKKIIPKDLYNVDLNPYSDKLTRFETTPTKDWVKPNKVLLIDSSPRAKKGYTNLYCDYIENSLREINVDVKHLILAQYKVQHCLGCLNCWLKSEGVCIIKDDANELYKLYDEAELIIYAFPLYAYSVPGMLKNFMDRRVMTQYPYFEKGITEIRHPRRNKYNKAFVTFSICGFPSFSQFDSVKTLFKMYSHSSYSPLVGEIYRPGGIFLLNNPFNYLKLKKFLEALRTAMHEIIEHGKIEAKTQKKLNVKIDENAFLESTNKYWDNLHKLKDVNY